jgi:hypothetical protein
MAAGSAVPASGGEVTFSEHIAPIVFSNCASCHRPGEAAPFSLLGYEDVEKRAKLVRDVVSERFMPPWHASRGAETFRGARVLTDEQVTLFEEWVEAGAPEGDPALAPPVPEFTEGWQLGEPDLVVSMGKAFEVQAGGRDIYRWFVLPLDLPEDKWVTAVEVRPSARSVVHHVLFFLDDKRKARELAAADTGAPGFGGGEFQPTGELGGWAVGRTPQHYPGGLALPLPKGSDLVLQTHFHPTGKAEREQTVVGLHFAEKAPVKELLTFQVPPEYGAMEGIDIPPGEAAYSVEDSWTVPVALDLITVRGHAHQACISMEGTATLPDGTRKLLLAVPEWDFNWQEAYQFRTPERLPTGSRIDVKIVYDNSPRNPANPFSPPQRIKWGQQSTDEMGSLIFQAVAVDEGDALAFARAEEKQRQVARGQAASRRAAR